MVQCGAHLVCWAQSNRHHSMVCNITSKSVTRYHTFNPSWVFDTAWRHLLHSLVVASIDIFGWLLLGNQLIHWGPNLLVSRICGHESPSLHHFWSQSPVELTPELRDTINSLGTLKHIVSPNYEHIKFAKQVCPIPLYPAIHLCRLYCINHVWKGAVHCAERCFCP